MNKEITDRRVRRTLSMLQKGLIQLMETKDIKDISVKELSDLADINRGTFYLHYNDIYDMLNQIEDELFVEFNEILDRTLSCDTKNLSPQATLLDIFSFLERHKEVARVMMGPHGDLAFVNRLKDLVKDRVYSILTHINPQCNYTYIEAFTVSGCIGVIEAWLNLPNSHSPQEMARICGEMLVQGLKLE